MCDIYSATDGDLLWTTVSFTSLLDETERVSSELPNNISQCVECHFNHGCGTSKSCDVILTHSSRIYRYIATNCFG